MAAGVHRGLRESNVRSRRCLGKRCQTRRNETICSRVKRLSSAGKSEAVDAAAAIEGSEWLSPQARSWAERLLVHCPYSGKRQSVRESMGCR